MFTDHISLFVISLVANFFSLFSPAGAGIIQLPALVFLGVPFAVAIATHKIASVAIGFGAAVALSSDQKPDKTFTLLILAAGIPGVLLGTQILTHVPDEIGHIALGILTIGLGLYSISSSQLAQQAQPIHRTNQGYALGAAGIFLIAILSGALTSGAGLLVTLWLVRWFGLDFSKAIVYSLILISIGWNAAGAMTLSITTEIHWVWLPALVGGALLGGFAAARFASKKKSPIIKRAYDAITLLVGIKLLMGSASWVTLNSILPTVFLQRLQHILVA